MATPISYGAPSCDIDHLTSNCESVREFAAGLTSSDLPQSPSPNRLLLPLFRKLLSTHQPCCTSHCGQILHRIVYQTQPSDERDVQAALQASGKLLRNLLRFWEVEKVRNILHWAAQRDLCLSPSVVADVVGVSLEVDSLTLTENVIDDILKIPSGVQTLEQCGCGLVSQLCRYGGRRLQTAHKFMAALASQGFLPVGSDWDEYVAAYLQIDLSDRLPSLSPLAIMECCPGNSSAKVALMDRVMRAAVSAKDARTCADALHYYINHSQEDGDLFFYNLSSDSSLVSDLAQLEVDGRRIADIPLRAAQRGGDGLVRLRGQLLNEVVRLRMSEGNEMSALDELRASVFPGESPTPIVESLEDFLCPAILGRLLIAAIAPTPRSGGRAVDSSPPSESRNGCSEGGGTSDEATRSTNKCWAGDARKGAEVNKNGPASLGDRIARLRDCGTGHS